MHQYGRSQTPHLGLPGVLTSPLERNSWQSVIRYITCPGLPPPAASAVWLSTLLELGGCLHPMRVSWYCFKCTKKVQALLNSANQAEESEFLFDRLKFTSFPANRHIHTLSTPTHPIHSILSMHPEPVHIPPSPRLTASVRTAPHERLLLVAGHPGPAPTTLARPRRNGEEKQQSRSCQRQAEKGDIWTR